MFQPSSSSSSLSSSLLLVAFKPSKKKKKKKDAETLWVRWDRWEIIEKVRKKYYFNKKMYIIDKLMLVFYKSDSVK